MVESQIPSGGTVLIGGDICPTSADTPYFVDGDAAMLFGDLLEEFQKADLFVVNLECPLTDESSPIVKRGPTLRAPFRCVAAIKKAGIGVLNLANNHILDHGPAGLESTLHVVETAGIATVGAGRNRDEARRILIRSVGGIRVGILGVAEHEFSIATAISPGANPLDLIDIVRNITAHKKEWDYLIVLLHGGNEGYPLPSPRLMDTCRFLVEQGAKAVICQHSHCVGCCEDYRGGHIVYGQGNFVFDSSAPPSGWNEGVLVRLCI
jgi:poly-gamma-glutamate synthesis protein (capsule biosynthesis protein)